MTSVTIKSHYGSEIMTTLPVHIDQFTASAVLGIVGQCNVKSEMWKIQTF